MLQNELRGSVLITRPETDSFDTAQDIENLNYHVICEPFLKVSFNDFTLPDLNGYAGLIFTSANGVRSVLDQITDFDIPVLCVGNQTYDIAVQSGFKSVRNANGTVDDLAKLISTHTADKPYLYIRAEDISRDLKALVEGVRIEEVVTYHADIIEEISTLSRQVLMRGEVGYIMFFSKRTAEAFIQWIKNDPQSASIVTALKHTRALCLGDSMVECLSVITWKDIQVATHPNRQGLLKLLK